MATEASRKRPIPFGVEEMLRACVPVFGVRTLEVERATRELTALAGALDMRPRVYSPGEGLTRDGRHWEPMDPLQVLDEILEHHVRGAVAGDTIWILQLFHAFLRDPDPIIMARLRALQDRAQWNGSVVLLLEPCFAMPPELRDLLVVDLPLPDRARLEKMAESEMEAYTEAERHEIAEALVGCTEAEAENILSLSLSRAGRFEPGLIRMFRERVLAGRIGPGLEVVSPPPAVTLEDVGGMEALVTWLRAREKAFLAPQALRRYGLPPPRGILLFGVPGCGKTLVAGAVAGSWGLPLLKIDAAALYTAEMGGSEARLRQALDAVRAASPCILLIDEIEKGFAPVSGYSDGGVALRIQGMLLEFLQERSEPVFVVSTCNGVQRMMPELLRRGRWDEIFFVDLPDERERTRIFEILYRRHGLELEVSPDCVKATEGFSGAEIEQAIREALYTECVDGGRPFHSLALLRQIRRMVPLYRLRQEEILSLREWARERARPANEPGPAEGRPLAGGA